LPLRYCLGQPTSTIDLSRILSRGTSLFLDLSDLGDEPAAILGAIVINQFKQAAEKVRKPYTLYIDEFQNFGTSIVSTILSESGKFGLQLVLAHQFLSQLEDENRPVRRKPPPANRW
jgi:type IV secretory pathway TraG/TraD family ATPase VirD4